mgnify:CR=1 FL=1
MPHADIPARYLRMPHVEKGMQVGLFGGSFNPPHAGHLLVADIALRKLRLDQLWWMVTPGNPLKSTRELAPLAARIALSDSLSNKTTGARPMRFIEAFAFQAANPKGWVMAIGAVTAYVPEQNYFWNLAIIVVVFGLIQTPSISVWTVFGRILRRFLDNPRTLRVFNITMGLLLALSLIPTVVELAGQLGR